MRLALGGSLHIHLAARFHDKQSSFLVDTGSMVSIISASQISTDVLDVTSTCLSTVKGDSIVVHGKRSVDISIPALRRSFTWSFYIADVTQNILGIDFLSFYKLSINCVDGTLSDACTGFTTSAQLSSTDTPVSSVCVVDLAFDTVSNSTLRELLVKHQRIFRDVDFNTDPQHSTVHRIETAGQPVHCTPRKLCPDKLLIAKRTFSDMVSKGICRPSNSPWASPLHMVPKKEPNSWRPCGDYRLLNSVTKRDSYPLPQVSSFAMKDMKIFSTLDLTKAYHQIPVHPDDIPKTAVTTPFGLFEFLRMPFGLRNAGQSFQRFMHEIFSELPFVFVFIDDIFVGSTDEKSHFEHLRLVFERLDSHGLRLGYGKCALMQKSVNFLGFEVSELGIRPNSDKISDLLALPAPDSYKCLRRIMGMFSFYRQHIPHYAHIIEPLQSLLNSCQPHKKLPKVEPDFDWKPVHFDAFEALKLALSKSVTLHHLSASSTLSLTTDASGRCHWRSAT